MSRVAGFVEADSWEANVPSLAETVVWVVAGLLGGTLAGIASTLSLRGFGFLRNAVVGVVGALLGGLIFRITGLWPELEQITISLRDVVAAFAGSLLVLLLYWIWQRYRRTRSRAVSTAV
jgi:uncharacterized membrane protein YeaQ/YmgE (transglycosylase-associated protein family)